MTTVLFSPETFNLAEVTRGIEIARRMPPGVRCVFSGYSRRYSQDITDAGFTYYALEPELTDRDADALLALDQGRGWRNPLTWRVMAERVAAERDLIRRTSADLVVIGTTLSQAFSARAEQVPLVYVKPFAYSLPHIRQMRRTGMTAPGAPPIAQVVDRVLAGLVRRALPRLTALPPGWKDVARAHGLPVDGPTLGLLEADLNLITTPRSFLPAGTVLPENYQIVGPIFARLPGEVPDLVRRLEEDISPTVYLAVGSSGQRSLVLDLLRGLAEAPVNVLAPVEHLLSADDLTSLPPHVHVTGWLPAHRLGTAVDLAITHGGEGTLQNSLAQGWPMIAVPLQLEQRYNILRCVEHGAALMVEPRDVRRTDWPALVAQTLSDAHMHARSAALADLFSQADGAATAAQSILQLLTTRDEST